VRFAFVHTHSREFPVQLMCQVLEVSRSGYYRWLRRRRIPAKRQQRQEQMLLKVKAVFERHRGIYGSPRVHRDLRGSGVACCRNTVARLMRRAGLRSVTRRRFRIRTTDSRHGHAVAANVLGRRFDQTAVDRAWAADLTYVATGQGWLYLAIVIDLCSRRVVGWAAADHMRAGLCTEALGKAMDSRRPAPGLIHHSDRGVQYACDEYQMLLQKGQMVCSMSDRGECLDNAVAESFFKSLKTEWTYHRRYATREQARQSLFEYIEVFYNRRRLHSSLGYVSPAQFEERRN